jgi:predicted DNA-binding transcriptional regulator AlpA
MPVEIRGNEYFSHKEVLERIGVERSTLWRWRSEGKVPMGRSSNSKQVYFTADEVAAIEEYAFGLRPIDAMDPTQLRLFNGKGSTR